MKTPLIEKCHKPPDKYIDINQTEGYSAADIPKYCRMAWLANYIGVSPAQLGVYRAIAFDLVPTYKFSALTRNPDYIAKQIRFLQKQNQGNGQTSKLRGRKKDSVAPDQPPFPYIEAVILVAIAQLFQELKHSTLVKSHIRENPEFYATL